MKKQYIIWGGSALAVIIVLMQFVHLVIPKLQYATPATTVTVAWDSPQTEQLWADACADCHSNDTTYPWYSYVAPVRWLVAHDINEGREELNISTDRRVEVDEMIETIREGEMPMPIYTITHPEARLIEAEKQALINGLRATFR